MSHAQIKPTHSAIKAFHAALQDFAAFKAEHEGATETAFGRLLSDTSRGVGWTLIPKQSMKVGGKKFIPDGTLRDLYLVRGYWEAKDTKDDLPAAIKRKIGKNYPTTNTIFEDSRQAWLYQKGRAARRFDLTQATEVADLLHEFYGYAEPDIQGFEEVVEEFKDRVPELAQGLIAKIKEAHDKNKKFQQAFDQFFELCKTALNPNIRRDAVDEMLVQHLLTERLFRKIFHDDEFTRRNGIPPKFFDYRLGNRSALDWVIDQYRVTEDARSGIVSDPNREDDTQYIGQVVAVSLETVKIVEGLPAEFA
jgi:hypothetical protein